MHYFKKMRRTKSHGTAVPYYLVPDNALGLRFAYGMHLILQWRLHADRKGSVFERSAGVNRPL